MQHIPAGVEEPPGADKAIGAQTSIRAKRHNCGEEKLPDSKPAIEICRASPRDHNCVEVLSLWLFQERTGANIEQPDEERWDDLLHDVIGNRSTERVRLSLVIEE